MQHLQNCDRSTPFNLGRHPVQTHLLNQMVHSRETEERDAPIESIRYRNYPCLTNLGDNYEQEAMQGAFNTATKRLTGLVTRTLESAASPSWKHGYNSWVCHEGYVSQHLSIQDRDNDEASEDAELYSSSSSSKSITIVVDYD